MTRRTYTDAEKAEAVGLALTMGPVKAARQLGIPHRNLSNWMRSPDAVVLRLESREQVAAKLWQGVVVGVDQVLAGLRDPNARLSDKARALEVLAQQHALLTGGVTERTETTHSEGWQAIAPVNVRAELARWMEVIENSTDEELAEHEAKAERFLHLAEGAIQYDPEDDGARTAYKRAAVEELREQVQREDQVDPEAAA